MAQLQARKDNLLALGILLASFGYYYLLCAKNYSWMFASFDSGDWLASSQIWMTPQPYGSPLYILLGHGVNEMVCCSCELPLAMTMMLSVLPASITVAVTYLIIRKLGYSTGLALTGSGTLLACGIFLSQATVLEEYAIATMFIAVAFYCYIDKRKYLTALSLGLGSAVHIIVVPITVLWLIVHIRNWRKLVKPLALYIVLCTGFYSLILGLMASDAPNIIAGGLSLESINDYLGSTETIGSISLHDTPVRLLQMGSVLLLGFSICLVPLVWGFRRPWQNVHKVMFLTVIFCAWLYATNTDMTTWTFMTFAVPIACIAIVIGLSRLPRWYTSAVAVWIVGMLIVNGVWLNANVLSKEYNEPEQFYNATMSLPDGSAIICNKGGAYGLGITYAMSSGKDIVPLFLQTTEGYDTQGYIDYIEWIEEDFGVIGDNWIEQGEYCMHNDREVFIAYYALAPKWQDRVDEWFDSVEYNDYYRKVIEAYDVPHVVLN